MTSPGPRSRTRTKATPAPPEDSSSKPAGSPLFLPPEDPPATFEMSPARVERILEAVTEGAPPSSTTDLSDALGPGPVLPSGTPSTDNPNKPAKLNRASLRGYARKAIVAAGKFAQARLTLPDSPERMEGMWVPDDDDVNDIANPVAGLVARRLPQRAGGVIANPDVEDGITLFLAVVAYVGKQLERRDRVRQYYAAMTPDMTADAEAVPA